MHARLRLRLHVEVAVVVVADVLLVQPGHRAVLVRRVQRAAVPVDDLVEPVGVDRRQQHEDDVVANRAHLRALVRRDAPGERHRVLRAGHLRSRAGRCRSRRSPCPAAARARASASESPRTCASRCAMSLYRASSRRFASDEMTATSMSRPSVDFPAELTVTRSDAASSFSEVVLDLTEVGELVVVARREAEDVGEARARQLPRRGAAAANRSRTIAAHDAGPMHEAPREDAYPCLSARVPGAVVRCGLVPKR